jgi:hypothetical protein
VRGIVALLVILLAACTSTPTSSPAPIYGPQDLHAIELRAGDAPRGLAIVPRFSRDQGLNAFARDDQERAALSADGFERGSGAVFVPRDRVSGGTLRVGDPIVQGTVAVFSRDDGASDALARYLQDLRGRQLRATSTGVVRPIGDETYLVNGLNSDGAHVTVIAWRRANLVLVMIGTSLSPAAVVSLAQLVDARAAGAA